MTDWQILIVDELKSLNRKLERLEDQLEKDVDPLKRHMVQSKFVGKVLLIVLPILAASFGYVI